jgi:hypothetical protein
VGGLARCYGLRSTHCTCAAAGCVQGSFLARFWSGAGACAGGVNFRCLPPAPIPPHPTSSWQGCKRVEKGNRSFINNYQFVFRNALTSDLWPLASRPPSFILSFSFRLRIFEPRRVDCLSLFPCLAFHAVPGTGDQARHSSCLSNFESKPRNPVLCPHCPLSSAAGITDSSNT